MLIDRDDLPTELNGDTVPDTDEEGAELVEALEWLKRAGVVSGERPAFAGFFDELAERRG